MNTIEQSNPQILYTARVRGSHARSVLLHTLERWNLKIEEHITQNPESDEGQLHDAYYVCKSLLKGTGLGSLYIAYNRDGLIKGVCEVIQMQKKARILNLLSSPEVIIPGEASGKKSAGAGAVLLAHLAKKNSTKKMKLISLPSAIDFYKHIGFSTEDNLVFRIKGKAKKLLAKKYKNNFVHMRDVRTHEFKKNSQKENRQNENLKDENSKDELEGEPKETSLQQEELSGAIPSLQDLTWGQKELGRINEITVRTPKKLKKLLKLPLTAVNSITVFGNDFETSDIKKICEKFGTTLKCLCLFDCVRVTSLDDCVFPVLDTFITSTCAIDDRVIAHLAKTSPQLKRLELDRCGNLSLFTNERFLNLEEIVVSACENLSNEGLKNISHAASSAQVFKLEEAANITTLEGCMFDKWDNLEYFRIRDVQVSKKELEKLQLRVPVEFE